MGRRTALADACGTTILEARTRDLGSTEAQGRWHGDGRIWVRAPHRSGSRTGSASSRPGLWTASALGRSCARLRMVAFEDKGSFIIFVRWWLLKLIGRARATAARTGALAVLA
eukprot:scaffold769_cov72-Phaeocystis_antarctica.AAC.2